ncbi:hypothetical protein GCM10010149_92820 [Nonomuraea roseoviolacea subsp. roseoviolacea]
MPAVGRHPIGPPSGEQPAIRPRLVPGNERRADVTAEFGGDPLTRLVGYPHEKCHEQA